LNTITTATASTKTVETISTDIEFFDQEKEEREAEKEEEGKRLQKQYDGLLNRNDENCWHRTEFEGNYEEKQNRKQQEELLRNQNSIDTKEKRKYEY